MRSGVEHAEIGLETERAARPITVVPTLADDDGLGYVVRATADGLTVEVDTWRYGPREGGLSVTYARVGYADEKVDAINVEVLQNGVVSAEREFESRYKHVGCDCLSSQHEFRWQEQQ